MKSAFTGLAFLLLLCGCTSARLSPEERSEIRKLDRADVDKEVAQRTGSNNWKFLAWYMDTPENTSIPGLSKEEGELYIGSGRYEYEYYYDQRTLYSLDYEGDMRPWIAAKYRYAERFNRELLRVIKKSNRAIQRATDNDVAAPRRV